MHARTLLVGAIWSMVLPQAVPAQTTESLRDYARGVYAAERAMEIRRHAESVDTTVSREAWPRALARLRPPAGYERLHQTLVRNARFIVSAANRAPIVEGDCTMVVGTVTENCPAASTPAPEGAEQRLRAAYGQYQSARERLAKRLRSAGVSLDGFPGYPNPR